MWEGVRMARPTARISSERRRELAIEFMRRICFEDDLQAKTVVPDRPLVH
jgi:hypothetical protein